MSDFLLDAFKVIVSVIAGGGAVSMWVAIRKDRREAPKDAADTLKLLLDRASEATVVATDALAKATASDRRAARAEEMVMVLRHLLHRHVSPIVTWIDNGANPPPPAVAQELRDFLSDLYNT